jgi:outer membrane protein assembly factor BamB
VVVVVVAVATASQTLRSWIYCCASIIPVTSKVYALDAGNGRELWTSKTGGYVSANPTLSPTGDVLYIGSYDKYVTFANNKR